MGRFFRYGRVISPPDRAVLGLLLSYNAYQGYVFCLEFQVISLVDEPKWTLRHALGVQTSHFFSTSEPKDSLYIDRFST